MELSKCFGCMEDFQGYPCPNCGYDPAKDKHMEYALPPETILAGKYMAGRVLGQGGFGITYIGWDIALERKVAIKEYYPSGQVSRSPGTRNLTWYSSEQSLHARQDGMQMFLKEARKMVKADSIPGVVRVLDLFQENGTAYIVMEFVEGETLKARLLRDGPMGWETAKKIFRPVISAMEQVHAFGLIHRDLSPDNLMLLPDGSVKILDLGAAKDLSLNSGASSMQVAKSGFSPLEQYIQRGGSGTWTDVYAMAATIYYTLTGTLIPGAVERLEKDTISWDFPALNRLPAQTREALKKALAVQAKDRTQTMEALEKGLFAEPVKVQPKPVAEKKTPAGSGTQAQKPEAPKKKKLWPWVAAAVAVLALAFALDFSRWYKVLLGPGSQTVTAQETQAAAVSAGSANVSESNVDTSIDFSNVAGTVYLDDKKGQYAFSLEALGSCHWYSADGEEKKGSYVKNAESGIIHMTFENGSAVSLRVTAVPASDGYNVSCSLFGGYRLFAKTNKSQVAAALAQNGEGSSTDSALPVDATEAAVAALSNTMREDSCDYSWRESTQSYATYPVFGSSYNRDQICRIQFLSSTASAGSNAWDISAGADGSVLAWTKPEGDLYALYIAANGKVYAPESCWSLFSLYENLKSIDFNGVFDTSKTTETAYMFTLDSSLTEIDVSNFDTSNVKDMSCMFSDCHSLESLDLRNFDFQANVNTEYFLANCISLTRLQADGLHLKQVDVYQNDVKKIKNATVYPYITTSPLLQCKEITVKMDVQMSSGTKNTDWDLWASVDGKFKKIAEINLPGGDGSVTQTISFDKPINIESLVPIPTRNGGYSWSMDFEVQDALVGVY